MLTVRDEPVPRSSPTGGTRVLAYPRRALGGGRRRRRRPRPPAASGDYAFVYLNLRMAKGRSDAVKQQVGGACWRH
jgi:5-carboxymethyl-2-hydroxymuconate isomerase